MSKEARHMYAINFDLKIKKLEMFYSKTHPKNAYKEIARYMYTHGFTHRQWSGYISDKTMTKTELIDFTLALHEAFPWLINCEENLDATVITSIFDIKQMILDTELEDEDIEL